jgi:Protein of unknown function (DUF4238)
MDHHYLPQSYLKQFTDPDIPEKQEPYVWIHSADTKRWKKRAPKNIAYEPNYYSLSVEDGKPNQDLEKLLSQIEGNMAKVMKDKIIQQQPLDDQEKATVAQFVALMMKRVPGVHENFEKSASQLIEKIAMMNYQQYSEDPQSLEKFKATYREETGKSDLDDLRLEDLDPKQYTVKVSKSFIVATSFAPLLEVTRIVDQMGWVFLRTQPPNYFITSDHPFSMVNPYSKSKWYGHGLTFSDIEVSLPLSREVSFFASWKLKGIGWSNSLNSAQVSQINIRTMRSASRFLVAPKTLFPASETVPME